MIPTVSTTLSADEIAIAITVFDRREYIREAVASALAQTVPVRVLVVEDCGPDFTLQELVKKEFGDRIEYIRNPRRRGLFDNWNACLDLCGTKWLSILHDDDFLAPNFVESLIKLSVAEPALDLYFGQTVIVDENSQVMKEQPLRPVAGPLTKIGLKDIIFLTPFPFPGHLFSVVTAKSVGGFCPHSYYCGDWEMWAKLIARTGAAQTADVVAYNRGHTSWNRGSSSVLRKGILTPASYVQHKRVLALMPAAARPKFDRVEYQRHYLISILFLLRYGAALSPRLLHYHVKLLAISKAPHWRYAFFKGLAKLGGAPLVRIFSKLFRLLKGENEKEFSLKT